MKSMKNLSFVSLTLIFFPVIYQIPRVAMATGTNTNSIPVTKDLQIQHQINERIR